MVSGRFREQDKNDEVRGEALLNVYQLTQLFHDKPLGTNDWRPLRI